MKTILNEEELDPDAPGASEVKTQAVVLRVFATGESNVVVRLLTARFGKISGVARNARKSMKRFSTSLDILDYGVVVLKPGRSSDLWLVESFACEPSFSEIRYDLDKLAGASLLTECFDLLLKEDIQAELNSQLFEAFQLALQAIHEATTPPEVMRAVYVTLSFLAGAVGVSNQFGSGRPATAKALEALLDDIERFLEKQLVTRPAITQVLETLRKRPAET